MISLGDEKELSGICQKQIIPNQTIFFFFGSNWPSGSREEIDVKSIDLKAPNTVQQDVL